MLPRSLFAALMAMLVLVPAAGADPPLQLSHVSVDAREESGDGDDAITPGDRIRLDHVFRSETAISAVSGTLTSVTPGVVIDSTTGGSAYASVPAGGQGRNISTYEAVIAGDTTCGQNISFTVAVTATEGSGDVSFTVPTGSPGPWTAQPGSGAALADDGATLTQLVVPSDGNGLVKDIRVRIPTIDHDRVGDLVLTLVAPDGTEVTLIDRRGGDGDDLTETVFADGGTPVAGASAPFTGTYAPEESLRQLEGRRLNGTWGLRIEDRQAGETGTLGSWELGARRAFCIGLPRAALSAAPAQVAPGGTVSFDASASRDDGGAIVSYEFDLDGNGTYEIGPTTDPTHDRTYTSRGTYAASVRVKDVDGLTDVESIRVPVTLPPVARITTSDPNPLSLTDVTFDAATSSDQDGSVARYQWDLDGDGAFESDTQATPRVTTSFSRPGPRTVRVLVTDDNGAQAQAGVAVDVRNRPPQAAVAAPALVVAGRAATFTAAASTDPDGSVVLYEWDLDANGTYERATGSTPWVAHTFTSGGPAAVGVRVTDDRDATHTASVGVVVRLAPVVALTGTPNPVSLRRTAILDAAGTTDGDSPVASLTYAWDLDGDGQFDDATGPAPKPVTFATAGTRNVGVRVTDPDGAATDRTVALVVRNILPLPALSAAPVPARVGAQVTLDAAASTDPDGSVVRYEWDLDDDGSFERNGGASAQTTTTFANPGWPRVRVRVTDDDGGAAVGVVEVEVVRPAPEGGATGGTGAGTPQPPPADAPGGAGTSTPTQPGDAGDPVTPTGQGSPGPGYTATLGGPPIQRLDPAVRRGVVAECSASARSRCVVEAFLSRADAKRYGLLKRGARRGDVKIGRASPIVEAGKTLKIKVKPSAPARKALRGRRTVRLILRGFARDWVGNRVDFTRVVLLRG